MDELVHHCLRELAFDGDLGCDVSRLRDFIHDFHTTHPQNVDDAYRSFVWSIIVQQPSVRVGTVPPGITTEVYVPAQRKSKGSGAAPVEESPAATLEVIPEATISPLDDLINKYGDKLRIAVDPETSFAAITGSHIRPAKLSPMVYVCLQLITRGRDKGISVLELGKKTKYDQKTCFYLVKQLLELDLIVKLRRGGNSQNFCIHKYFFDRSPLWQQIRAEEARISGEVSSDLPPPLDASTESGEPPSDSKGKLRFDPIDAHHLSSLPLLRSRILKLLSHSKNGMHMYNNIMMAIGFPNPSKSNRRFFSTRLRELIAEGIVEKVLVVNPTSKSANAKVLCLRLTSSEGSKGESVEEAIVQPEDAGDEKEEDIINPEDSTETGLKVNYTVHKHMIDLLEKAGTTGMTLNELSATLGSFDKRTLELLITRLEKYPPPPHLSDLGIVQVKETHGRERRYRYFTLANYRTLVAQEGLEDPSDSYAQVDLSRVGGFSEKQPADFFQTFKDLAAYQDTFKDTVSDCGIINGKRKNVNPELPDGTRKKGRPRKDDKDLRKPRKSDKSAGAEKMEGQANTLGKKRKRAHDDEVNGEDGDNDANQDPGASPPPARKRGRPKKKKRPFPDAGNGEADEPTERPSDDLPGAVPPASLQENGGSSQVTKRPHPSDAVDEAEEQPGHSSPPGIFNVAEGSSTGKRRGRPPKKRNVQKVVVEPDEPTQPAPHDDQNGTAMDSVNATIEDPLTEDSLLVTGRTDPIDENGSSSKAATLEMIGAVASEPGAESSATRSNDVPLLRLPSVIDNNQRPSESEPLEEDSPRRSSRNRKPTARAEYATSSSPLRKKVVVKPSILSQLTRPTDDPMQSQSAISEPVLTVTEIVPASSDEPLPDVPLLLVPQPGQTEVDGHEMPPLASDVGQTNGEPSGHAQSTMTHGSSPESNEKSNASLTTEDDRAGTRAEDTEQLPPQSQSKPSDSPRLSKAKPNISQSRRENELIRVIEDMGGIANTSTKEFSKAHIDMLEMMTKAGEVASAPIGTRLDRRTLDTALSNLESRKRIKLLTTSITPFTGAIRQVKVAYLFNLEQEKVDAFLADLNRTFFAPQLPAIRELVLPVGQVSDVYTRLHTPALQKLQGGQPSQLVDERWSRNTERATQLFNYSDETIRDMLLAEKQTLAQLYGFIIGRLMRVRRFHLATLGRLESGELSPRIVSAEHRIIDATFYYTDLHISDYCAIISSLEPVEGLADLLQTEEGKRTPVSDIPLDLRTNLRIGRSRCRSRILDILVLLLYLKVATPLQASDSVNPLFRCAPNGSYPTAFEPASLDGWTSFTPAVAPQFWHFNETAPIHLWALSEQSPPFYKEIPIASTVDSIAYWQELQEASQNKIHAQSVRCPDVDTSGGILDCRTLAVQLRRKVSWNFLYVLSWHQSQYLKKFLDLSTGNTPLQDADGGASRLQRICHLVCAPSDVVRHFFVEARAKQLRELGKIERRRKRKEKEAQKPSAEAKTLLEKKAAEAKLQRERDWDELVQRVHPDPLAGSAATRVKRLRNKFLHGVSGKDPQAWQDDITVAIQESRKPYNGRKLFPRVNQTYHQMMMPAAPSPPLVIRNEYEKSVESLVTQQGALLSSRPKKAEVQTRRSKKGEDVVNKAERGRVRRHRFHWTHDYDELARDAAVIVTARSRDNCRMDWAPLEQVFPAVQRNSVRQRIAKLKAAPGAEAYLKRLEDCWHNLWLQHRGTAILPDDDLSSQSNFDLIKHIDFLRRHIDKVALRVGFTQSDDQPKNILPSDPAGIEDRWVVTENVHSVPQWDFLWNVHTDESREKNFLQDAFVVDVESMTSNESSSNIVYVAESALKMALGTPNERYNADKGSRLLYGVGEQAISVGTGNLLSRGVLSKLVRDPTKSAPGRRLKISEINQNALGGMIPRDTFTDAAQLEDLCTTERGTWRDWPLVAPDGDTAALIQLVSDHKVEFEFDTSRAQSTRPLLDWNSKKAGDDDIELSYQIYLRDDAVTDDNGRSSTGLSSLTPLSQTMELDPDSSSGHGMTQVGELACCRMSSDGVVDCHRCIEQAISSLISSLSTEEMGLASRILKTIEEAGHEGSTIDHILASVENVSRNKCLAMIRRMSTMDVPVVYWAGYTMAILVSSKYLNAWTVVTSDEGRPQTKLFPRRWVDISGKRITEVWDAALKAVMGIVLFRPGISQGELRWRLRAVYDRQEIDDILRFLHTEGSLERRLDLAYYISHDRDVGEEDDEEEQRTHWFIGEGRHWYQLP